jgi:hypothetical protein
VRHASPSKQKWRLAIRTLNFANQQSLLVCFGRHANRALRREFRHARLLEHPGRAEIKHEGSASVKQCDISVTRRRARGPRFRRAHRTSGAARYANEADDFFGAWFPQAVVLLRAEERQRALLRNEARRIAANIAKLPELLKQPRLRQAVGHL